MRFHIGFTIESSGISTLAILKAKQFSTDFITCLAVVASLFISFQGCVGDEESQSDIDIDGLVTIHCGSCHLVPEPGELTRDRWEDYVLPRMGYFLGIYDAPGRRAELIEDNAGGAIVEAAQVFPNKPIVEDEDWAAIKRYFLDNAPESIEVPEKRLVETDLFEAIFPDIYLSPPSSTLVQFGGNGGLYLGDAHTRKLYELSPDFKPVKTADAKEGVVGVEFVGEEMYATVMGQFSPTDAPLGFIFRMPLDASGPPSVVIDKLQRPVHTAYGDLHGDGRMDIVVCEFGKWTGGLSLYEALGNGKYEKHILLNTPGATRAYIRDLNGDGREDIIALFAQGNEGIDIFYNKGDSQFSRTRVLRFPSSYGSSFFDLFDFNEDGSLDIIYTAGDNADFKPLMKPYHGVYIFTNDGSNNFEQAFFHHINGAYKAIPVDFDNDGDIDIATISFFPDWEKSPEEGFVLLRNTGKGEFSFSPYTFDGVDQGRWITMDAADYDSDGDVDLILGSLAFEAIPDLGQVEKWTRNGIPFVVLRNLRY